MDRQTDNRVEKNNLVILKDTLQHLSMALYNLNFSFEDKLKGGCLLCVHIIATKQIIIVLPGWRPVRVNPRNRRELTN